MSDDSLIVSSRTGFHRDDGHSCPTTDFSTTVLGTPVCIGHGIQDRSVSAALGADANVYCGLLMISRRMKDCGMLSSAVRDFTDFSFSTNSCDMLVRQTAKAMPLCREELDMLMTVF